MSMKALEEALEAIAESDRARFLGPRDPSLVETAEQALGVTFPPTYRRFVLELGAGCVGWREFYGVTADDFASASVPNGIWLTLDERRECHLPDPLVIVEASSMGEY